MPAPRKRPQTSTPHEVAEPRAASFSKITAPTLHRVHANTRLFDRLDTAFERRIVWIHGPPGAGKTTLVASYLAARGICPLWYRLDEGDADPATLFFYLATAAARGAPATLPLLTPELRGALPTFARRFFRDLFARPAVVVFDDYHEVAPASPLHESFPHGLEEIPAGSHVVVISRTPPPAQLARLRLNGAIEVVEPGVLRMTEAEALGLAHERGAEAGVARIEAITRQTQGWAAGVILMLEAAMPEAAVPPQGPPAVPEVLFDYFAGEILRQMEPHRRSLLPKLALLPSPAAAQAVALTQDADAAALLEDLRRRNYFTTHDLAAEPRYRFHPLFRAFLEATLRAETTRDRLDDFRVRAAHLLDADDEPDAAVRLLAEANAHATIADIIRRRAKAIIAAGRHETLMDWFAKIPNDAIERDAWLCNWYAESHIYHDMRTTWSRLSQALARFEADGDVDGQLLAWSGLAEIVRADAFGDFARYDALIATLRKLLAHIPPIEQPEIMVRVGMGMALALARRTNAREEIALWQERTRRAGEQLNDSIGGRYAFMFAITDMHDANYAKAICALDAKPDPLTAELSLTGCVSGLIAHGMALVYRLKPGNCELYVEAALRRCDALGYHGWSHLLCGLVMHDVCRRGDHDASAKWLARMKAYAAPYAADRGAHYHTLAAYHHLLHDDLRTATEHAAHAVEIATRAGWPFFQALAGLVLAETRIDAGDFLEAEAELDRLDALLARNATRILDAGAICARADLAIARGDRAMADATLARALLLGRQQGDRRLGLSAARMRRLFAFALERGIEPDYVRTLIRELGLTASDPFDERWPRPIAITTLGGLAVSRDGAPLTFTRKTPKRLIQLLKAIVAHGGRAVPEEKLVDAVWPDEEGDAARSALTIAIHRLRKLLGDGEAIVVSGGTVGLDPTRCWVDVWTIEHLLRTEPTFAEIAAEHAARHERTPCCERVFALYHGDFLPEDRDFAWTAPLRRSLRRRFARMICLRADANVTPVDELFQRGLDAAPEVEDIYQGLMRHHLAEGRANDGLAVYDRLREMLRDTDDAAPSPTSETLRQKLQAI